MDMYIYILYNVYMYICISHMYDTYNIIYIIYTYI